MPVTEIKSLEEFHTIINGDKLVVIDFWASWCGPCRAISPVFLKHSDSGLYPGITFYKVDIDDQGEIAQEVGVRALPTFALFQNGNKIKGHVGGESQRLESLLNEASALVS